MNLGDGLVFKLENGKPKLVLSSHTREFSSAKKAFSITRPQKVPFSSKGNRDKRACEKLQGARVGAAGSRAAAGSRDELRNTDAIVSNNESTPQAGCATRFAKVPQAQEQTTAHSHTELTTETQVCLSQEQLLQILSTIDRASGATSQSQPQSVLENSTEAGVEDTLTKGVENSTVRNPQPAHNEKGDTTLQKMKDGRMTLNGAVHDLFSTLGERERKKDILEARREQWKKELGEQVAFKQQQKNGAEASLGPSPWDRRQTRRTVHTHHTGNGVSEAEKEKTVRLVPDPKPGLPDPEPRVQTPHRQQHLPAAIRSAFVLGGAAPLEHAFNAQKQEERRRWLEELNQQREEARLRRLQEQHDHAQGQDLERWAMHFDSLQRRPSSLLPPPGEEAESKPQSTCSAHRHLSPPVTSSLASDGTSSLGEDHLGRESVDTCTGAGQRTRELGRCAPSHVRTMTALLDPAQIEDRERKRLKQLEHQRAIAAQVEERRRQREKEAALRREENQQEEQRVARERERLEQQYQLDLVKQRHNEEVQTQKTEELYLRMRKAQEDAMHSRQQQRIRDLARKGHDVSKLLHSLDGGADSASAGSGLELNSLLREDGPCVRAETAIVSPKKDMAVQTDVDIQTLGLVSATPLKAGESGLVSETSDAAISYKHAPSVKKDKREGFRLGRNPRMGKENLRAVDGGVLCKSFTRTNGGGLHLARARPDWNVQRPSKPFVPASERHPTGCQAQRPTATLALMGKGGIIEPASRDRATPQPSQRPRLLTHSEVDPDQKSTKADQLEHGHLQGEPAERPLSSFVPYVRTDEVFHLDPLAPISRPPTRELHCRGQPGEGAEYSTSTSSAPQRDPLLNPALLKSKERQQAILRGLSELRQGLLLKQKELETGLKPFSQQEAPPK